MASCPITSWQIEGEKAAAVTDFILGGSKITVDGDCSHETRKCLLLGRKAMTNLDSVLKSRDITLPTKVHLIKAMDFPIVTFGCESWTACKHAQSLLLLLLLLSHSSHVRLCATPRTIAYQAPLSMEFSRQEYWSGLLFPSPEDLPNQGSPASQADSLPLSHLRSP